MESSLKKLQTDYLDAYYIHSPLASPVSSHETLNPNPKPQTLNPELKTRNLMPDPPWALGPKHDTLNVNPNTSNPRPLCANCACCG